MRNTSGAGQSVLPKLEHFDRQEAVQAAKEANEANVNLPERWRRMDIPGH